jgi:beta-glucanase (GH16 family)
VASGKRWAVTFAEEFNGSAYDHEKLTPCFDWNYGGCTDSFNKGREHYDPAQVRVSGGTAKLVAEPLTPALASNGCFENQCTYKSGLLATSRPKASDGSDYLYAFTYGYVASRLKFPGTQGFFTAFWMLPTDPSYSYRSEIDIVEILGDDPNTIFMTYHYADRSRSHAVNNGKRNNGDCAVKDYSQDFHEFGVDWQPGHVAWYIDGTKCDEFTGSADQIESGPMQLIMDLMVDHSWQQDWDVTLQDTTLVRQIEVDWIRVYQQE